MAVNDGEGFIVLLGKHPREEWSKFLPIKKAYKERKLPFMETRSFHGGENDNNFFKRVVEVTIRFL